MRISLLAATILTAFCGVAQASGTFIELETPDIFLTKISGNGEYAVGSGSGDEGIGYRWTSTGNVEELLPALNVANGINNSGTIAGAIPENGGADSGGRDIGAYSPLGSAPILLSNPLLPNSNGWGIADDGTIVGLSFDDGFMGEASAFVWNATDGMAALPVNRPDYFSRANDISADGSVIVGWNDDDFTRNAVIWQDRVPLELLDSEGFPLGEATDISDNGRFVVGVEYYDPDGNYGAWRWNADTGLTLIPNMEFAFGVSDDGKTVVGSSSFFDPGFPPRTALIWREGVGTTSLVDFLAAQGIALPAGWESNLMGAFGAISADGLTMGGFSTGPLGVQSYVIRLDRSDVIMQDGFDGNDSAR